MNGYPSTYEDLLTDEAHAFAYLATLMPDGSPHVTPIWFNTDGEIIWINTSVGRVKARNMRVRPQVALAIADPKNMYRYVQIRGRVLEISETGADEHIDALAVKYTGAAYAWRKPGMVRLKVKILPEKIIAQGG
jgi:PPOX class probable F420-dependent enzyme